MIPMFQYDRHTLHCVLGSVSSNSTSRSSQHPESFCFDWGLKGLNDWFCRRSCWRACRSGWFSIFLIYCRTLVLCAYFTTDCGSPGNSEAHVHLAHHHWLMILVKNSHGLLHSFTKYFIINVERIAFMNRTYSRAVLCFSWVKSSNKSNRSVITLLNIETLAVFRWTCLNFLFQEVAPFCLKNWLLR